MPVSDPFCTRSEQVGRWQMKSEQARLAQSLACWQPARSGHGLQTPPQSTSVSFWLRVSSEQDAARQTFWAQTPLAQSASVPQSCSSAQGGQSAPPQSVAVSWLSVLWLTQSWIVQMPPAQTPDSQSASVAQVAFNGHGVSHASPQSVSASLPFFRPSLHEGASQVLAVQTPLAHWAFSMQCRSVSQRSQPPPQS